ANSFRGRCRFRTAFGPPKTMGLTGAAAHRRPLASPTGQTTARESTLAPASTHRRRPAMTHSTRRTVAVLKAPRSVPALITYARAILTAMTGNPRFPNPSPQLADVKRSTDDLEVSEAAARARTRGAAG